MLITGRNKYNNNKNTMNTKKYVICAVAIVTMLTGSSLVFAKNDIAIEKKLMAEVLRPRPMVVEIGHAGRTLLRGTVSVVGSSSITVKSWGGNWVVNISSDTNLIPGNNISQFKVGDFVGVHGTASQTALWTIDAKLVRNWSASQEIQSTKKEIKEIMKEQMPKNWQGIISNINTSNNSFTLTIESIAHTVNLAVNAKIVNQKFMPIAFSDVKSGDTVRVWGPASGTTITAFVFRDISIAVQ